MAGYHGRRGPNVSQYVANLNTVPAPQDVVPEPLNIEEDIALFTNSDFIDWDAADFDLNTPLDFDLNGEQQQPQQQRNNHRPAHAAPAAAPVHMNHHNKNENKTLDFVNTDFQFTDFAGYQNPIVEPSMPNLPPQQQQSRVSHNSYPVPPSYTSPVSASVSPISPQFDISAGKKRKLQNIDPNSQQAIDEAARIAAEEDKRRRNTAASARFRVKKKQREQALEKTAKEMSDRVNVLESRISQLEMENNWLKSLITEKNEKSSPPDISAMYKKFTEENAGERSTGGRTDGVGTVAREEKADA